MLELVDMDLLGRFLKVDLTRKLNKTNKKMQNGNTCIYPGDPITLSKDEWGVQSPPQQGI